MPKKINVIFHYGNEDLEELFKELIDKELFLTSINGPVDINKISNKDASTTTNNYDKDT